MPNFSIQPDNGIVKIGGNISFKCCATSIPLPDYVWYKEDSKILNDGSHIITSDLGCSHLNISNAKNKDNGTYHCEALNSADSALSSRSTIISLLVQGNKCNYRRITFVS